MSGGVRIFVSFDHDHDEDLFRLLYENAQIADAKFELVDWSPEMGLVGDWQAELRARFRTIDVVVVICGSHADTAVAVNSELQIAQQTGTKYVLLGGWRKITRRPRSAKASDKIYQWSRENLERLLKGYSLSAFNKTQG